METKTVHRIFAAFFLIVFSVLVSWRASHIGNFADDFDFLVRRTHSISAHDIFLKNTDGTNFGGSWRPLTMLTFVVSMEHSVSVALYGICAIFIFLIAEHIFGTEKKIALAAMIIFLLIPIHAEPVMWIAARADVLAGAFALASLYAWIRGVRVLAFVCFIASLLAKEVWVLLPIAFLFFDHEHNRAAPRLILKWASIFFITIVIWFLFRRYITSFGIGGYSIPTIFDAHIFARIGKAIVSYIVGVFTYGITQAAAVRWATLHFKILCVGAVAGAVIVWRATPHGYKFLWIAHAGVLAPILLLEVPFQRVMASVGEQRYWFAPSAILVLLLAALVFSYIKKPQFELSIIAIIIAYFSIGFVTNVAYFSAAAKYRDTIITAWSGADSVVALPDTYHGVHMFAAPFFYDALVLAHKNPPEKIVPWYQYCSSACSTEPLIVLPTINRVVISASQPRLIHVGEHGLRHIVELSNSSSSTLAIWNGAQFIQIPPQAVENHYIK